VKLQEVETLLLDHRWWSRRKFVRKNFGWCDMILPKVKLRKRLLVTNRNEISAKTYLELKKFLAMVHSTCAKISILL
jgi:hypothetical protein